MSRAAAAAGRPSRCTRPKPDEEQRALTPAELEAARSARAALERLLEGFRPPLRRAQGASARRSTSRTSSCGALELLRSSPALAASLARALRPRDGRRVPGHQQRPAAADRAAARPADTAASWSATRTSRSTGSATPTSRSSAASARRRRARSDRDVLPLLGNFRSLPAVLAGVNEVGRTLLDGFAELTAGRDRRRATGRGRAAADARRGPRQGRAQVGPGGDRPRAAAGRLAAAGGRRGALPRRSGCASWSTPARPSAARSSSCCAPSPTSTPTRRRCDRAGLRPFVVGGRGYWTQQQVEDLIRLLGVVSNPLDDEYLFGALACFANAVSPDALWLLRRAASDEHGRAAPRLAADRVAVRRRTSRRAGPGRRTSGWSRSDAEDAARLRALLRAARRAARRGAAADARGAGRADDDAPSATTSA